MSMTARSTELLALEKALATAVAVEIRLGEVITDDGTEDGVRLVDVARAALDAHLAAVHARECEYYKAHKHDEGRSIHFPYFGLTPIQLIALNEKSRAEHTRIDGERRAGVAEEIFEAVNTILDSSAKKPAKTKKG